MNRNGIWMSKVPNKSFVCPHCNKRFQWTTEIADRKAQCPACHKRIRIPTVPGRIAEAVDPLPQTPKPQQPKHESGTYELDLTGVDETIVEPPPTPAQQAAAQTGRCPACNQSIKPDAVICIKCGYNLKKGKRIKTAVAEGEAAVAAEAGGGAMPAIGASPVASALMDREDEAGTNKFIELWLPLGLILLGITVRFIQQIYFTGSASAGVTSAAIYVGIDLALTIPLLLTAMIIAVKLLDVAFGPLGPALFKMAAVVLGPAAIGSIVAFLIGGADGNIAGMFAGLFVSFIAYWGLISLLFELDGIESMYFIAIITALNWIVTIFVIGMVLSLFG